MMHSNLESVKAVGDYYETEMITMFYNVFVLSNKYWFLYFERSEFSECHRIVRGYYVCVVSLSSHHRIYSLELHTHCTGAQNRYFICTADNFFD